MLGPSRLYYRPYLNERLRGIAAPAKSLRAQKVTPCRRPRRAHTMSEDPGHSSVEWVPLERSEFLGIPLRSFSALCEICHTYISHWVYKRGCSAKKEIIQSLIKTLSASGLPFLYHIQYHCTLCALDWVSVGLDGCPIQTHWHAN